MVDLATQHCAQMPGREALTEVERWQNVVITNITFDIDSMLLTTRDMDTGRECREVLPCLEDCEYSVVLRSRSGLSVGQAVWLKIMYEHGIVKKQNGMYLPKKGLKWWLQGGARKHPGSGTVSIYTYVPNNTKAVLLKKLMIVNRCEKVVARHECYVKDRKMRQELQECLDWHGRAPLVYVLPGLPIDSGK